MSDVEPPTDLDRAMAWVRDLLCRTPKNGLEAFGQLTQLQEAVDELDRLILQTGELPARWRKSGG